MAKALKADDPAMTKVRALWARKQDEGWTQQQLGLAMGYPDDSARKSVSQFLKSRDPQISMLRKFAKAAGVRISELVNEQPLEAKKRERAR